MKILNCIVCGKEFVKITCRKTCSEECYRTHYNAKMVERRRRINGTKEIPCRFCGDIFLPKKRDLKVCDKEECKRLARLEASKQYRQSENGKEKRRNLEAQPKNRKKKTEYSRQHREQNREIYRSYNTGSKGKERSQRYRDKHSWRKEYEKNIAKYRTYYKEHYQYKKDTFTKENESCYKYEQLIDNFFHEHDITHQFQVRFDFGKQYCIADWVIVLNERKFIIEYFGLVNRLDTVGDTYRSRVLKKLELYSLQDLPLIAIYPDDIKQKLNEIRRMAKLNQNLFNNL